MRRAHNLGRGKPAQAFFLFKFLHDDLEGARTAGGRIRPGLTSAFPNLPQGVELPGPIRGGGVAAKYKTFLQGPPNPPSDLSLTRVPR